MNIDAYKRFLEALKPVQSGDRLLFTSEHGTIECVIADNAFIAYGVVVCKHTGAKYRRSAINPPLPMVEDIIDLETDEDFIEKSFAICNNLEYDKRIIIPLDFTDSEIEKLKELANAEGISVDQFVENILMKIIEKDTGIEVTDLIDNIQTNYIEQKVDHNDTPTNDQN